MAITNFDLTSAIFIVGILLFYTLRFFNLLHIHYNLSYRSFLRKIPKVYIPCLYKGIAEKTNDYARDN